MVRVYLRYGPYDGHSLLISEDLKPEGFWYESARDPHPEGVRQDGQRIFGHYYRATDDPAIYEFDSTGGPVDTPEFMPGH